MLPVSFVSRASVTVVLESCRVIGMVNIGVPAIRLLLFEIAILFVTVCPA